MELTTKFDMGQTVAAIVSTPIHKTPACEGCGGTGRIELAGQRPTCPLCHGLPNTKRVGTRWSVYTESTIGKIKYETRTTRHAESWKVPEIEINYMLESTGVESGTLWKEADVFATVMEAQAECDRRNGVETTTLNTGDE